MIRKKAVACYAVRDANLRSIGYLTYGYYCRCDLWIGIRARVFELYGKECFACGAPAEQVHHSDYSIQVLRGEDLSKLYPVCGDCHLWCEFDNGFKVSPRRATDKLKKRRASRGLSVEREGTPTQAEPKKRNCRVFKPPPGLRAYQEPPWGQLTRAELDLYRTKKGSWGRPAFAALGLPNPPPKGWLRRLLRPEENLAQPQKQRTAEPLPTLADVGREDGTWPTVEEINALEHGNGGWSRSALASLGVPWPPPKGWKRLLESKASRLTP